MARGGAYSARIVPQNGRSFPKKILTHRRIPINETYACTASIWVADTPESNRKPTINLVISHASSSLRLCFNSVVDLREAVVQLYNFVLDKAFVVNDSYNDALREFVEYHEGKRMQTLNDNTVSTVIQDISENKYRGKRSYVVKKTGEIIEV